MSENPNGEKTMDGGFVSAYDANKDSSPSQPLDTQDAGLIVPDHTDVREDDAAEPADADVQHTASPEDVEAKE